MLKSSSTKRMTATQIIEKTIYWASKFDRRISRLETKLEWIISKFNRSCGFILTTYLPYL